VVAQTYYNGTKESERPAIANLLKGNGLLDKKIVLDALHLTPSLLNAIHEAKGTYLIGLKANQRLLKRSCLIQTMLTKPAFERVDAPVRGHGRVDERTYGCYSLAGLRLARRWAKSGLTTVVVVTRVRRTLAGVETSRTVSYFVTNCPVSSPEEADSFYDMRKPWYVLLLRPNHWSRNFAGGNDNHRQQREKDYSSIWLRPIHVNGHVLLHRYVGLLRVVEPIVIAAT
jgi:hypothetical protein